MSVQDQGLMKAVRFFTEETGIMESYSVTTGCGDRSAMAEGGTQDGETPVGPYTLYDLASLTKLFTGLTAMKLWENGMLDLDRRVTDYAPAFTALHDVTIDQLLTFQVKLQTKGRLDACNNANDAEQCLFGTIASSIGEERAYSDIHAMILGYVMEEAAQETLQMLIGRLILRPLDMQETYAEVPAERLSDCILTSGEHRIERARMILNEGPSRGIPHDAKARLLQQKGKLCGHAGLFSTRADMEKLCRGILEEKLIRPATL